MKTFRKRSFRLELLDQPNPEQEDLEANLRELIFINRHTGGHYPVWEGLKKLIPRDAEKLSVLDIGTGAGDVLYYLRQKLEAENINCRLTGIDVLPGALSFAKKNFPEDTVTDYLCADYRDYLTALQDKPDVIVAGLFCHHLEAAKIPEFLKLATASSRIGVLINDLHRSPVSYYFIKAATNLFSRSRFTINDAPLSVLKGFTAHEWKEMLEAAGLKDYEIKWKWAYRHLIVISNKEGFIGDDPQVT